MRRLRKAYLEITNVCNLACDFCPGTRRAPGFLSPEGFRILAASLRPHTDYLYLHLMGSRCSTLSWATCWRRRPPWASG